MSLQNRRSPAATGQDSEMCVCVYLSLSFPVYVPTSATPLDTEIFYFLAVFHVLSGYWSDVEMAHDSPTGTPEEKSFTLSFRSVCHCQYETTLGPERKKAERSQ